MISSQASIGALGFVVAVGGSCWCACPGLTPSELSPGFYTVLLYELHGAVSAWTAWTVWMNNKSQAVRPSDRQTTRAGDGLVCKRVHDLTI